MVRGWRRKFCASFPQSACMRSQRRIKGAHSGVKVRTWLSRTCNCLPVSTDSTPEGHSHSLTWCRTPPCIKKNHHLYTEHHTHKAFCTFCLQTFTFCFHQNLVSLCLCPAPSSRWCYSGLLHTKKDKPQKLDWLVQAFKLWDQVCSHRMGGPGTNSGTTLYACSSIPQSLSMSTEAYKRNMQQRQGETVRIYLHIQL